MKNKAQITIGTIMGVASLLSGIFWGAHKLEIEPLQERTMSIEARMSSNEANFNSFVASTNIFIGQFTEVQKQVNFLAEKFGYQKKP